MLFEALLFIVGSLYLAVCANVARRIVQTRFWQGLAALVVALAVPPMCFLSGVWAIVATGVALLVTIIVSRKVSAREDNALDRMQGSLIGLLTFQAMLLVAALLSLYVNRSEVF